LQAGTFLVHLTDDFRHSTVVLRQARNLKFAGFVRPGEILTVHVEMLEHEGEQTTVKGEGWIGEVLAVSGRLVLERYNAGEREPRPRSDAAAFRAAVSAAEGDLGVISGAVRMAASMDYVGRVKPKQGSDLV